MGKLQQLLEMKWLLIQHLRNAEEDDKTINMQFVPGTTIRDKFLEFMAIYDKLKPSYDDASSGPEDCGYIMVGEDFFASELEGLSNNKYKNVFAIEAGYDESKADEAMKKFAGIIDFAYRISDVLSVYEYDHGDISRREQSETLANAHNRYSFHDKRQEEKQPPPISKPISSFSSETPSRCNSSDSDDSTHSSDTTVGSYQTYVYNPLKEMLKCASPPKLGGYN